MKYNFPLLLTVVLVAGCATSTVASRKQARAGAFAALSPEFQALVADGQISRGMTEDAVYIAWGKPMQILHEENWQGRATTWLYEGGWMEQTRYWIYRSRVPTTDFQPRTFVRAEIIFMNGVVESWRTLPQPVN